jgi:hypothetical protein
MDDFLQALFPQAPSYLTGLLGEEQALAAQKQAQQQGLLGLGLGLLQAAAPAPVRPSLGAGLAQGLASGQQAYQNVFQQRVQEQMVAQQFAEMQKKRQQQEMMQRIVPTLFQTTTETVPGEEGQPPTQRQRISVDPQRLQLLAAASADPLTALKNAAEAAQNLRKAGLVPGGMGGADPFAPFMTSDNPNIRAVAQQYSRAWQSGAIDEATAGQRAESLAKMVESTGKPIADIASYQFYVTQERAAGREPKSYERYQEDLKKAGAQTIIEKTSGLAIGKIIEGSIERTNNSQLAATAANQTLQTIADIKPILKEGVLSGPLSGQVAVVARLATTLGITGQNTQDLLNNTAEAMQRLADIELKTAEQMRGQGAITENERALIARAAGGNLASMTAGEVNTLLNALEKTAKFKIQGHIQNVNILRKVLPEEAKPYADAFTTEFAAPVPQQRIRSQAASAARGAGLIE